MSFNFLWRFGLNSFGLNDFVVWLGLSYIFLKWFEFDTLEPNHCWLLRELVIVGFVKELGFLMQHLICFQFIITISTWGSVYWCLGLQCSKYSSSSFSPLASTLRKWSAQYNGGGLLVSINRKIQKSIDSLDLVVGW